MNWKKLSYSNPKTIKRLQDKLLRRFIREQIPYSPYYREIFKKNKIGFNDIKTTDDLVKLPFTSKEDIAPSAKNSKKPLEFVLQPNEKLIKQYMPKYKLLRFNLRKKLRFEYKPIHMHFTTGRTALPTSFLYSAKDIILLEEAGKRMFDVFNVKPDYRAVNAFPYVPHLAFWQTFFGLKKAGVLSLHSGGGKILGTEKIIKSAQGMKADLIIGMPGYVYHLIKKAKEEKADFSSVKQIILGGERVSAGLRDALRNLLIDLGAKKPDILSTYAFTEGKIAWPQCSEKSGYHLYPDMEFIEIVDKNNEGVEDGEKGEICYTALDWRGSVVLRYKTGDIGSLNPEKCAFCGRTVPRIDIDIERKSEYKEFMLTKVKGELINLNSFFQLLMAYPGVEEWQIELRKKNNDPYELDELILYIATKKGISFRKLAKQLKEKIKNITGISPTEIIEVKKEDLLERLGMEKELKEKRIIDNRAKK